MGGKGKKHSKRFVDKKSDAASHFQLLHRSRRDEYLQTDESASEYVLIQTQRRPPNSALAARHNDEEKTGSNMMLSFDVQ